VDDVTSPDSGTESLASTATALLEQLRTQVENRPYAAILVAAGAGYVLGGGVPTWAVRTAANFAGRVLVAKAMASVADLE